MRTRSSASTRTAPPRFWAAAAGMPKPSARCRSRSTGRCMTRTCFADSPRSNRHLDDAGKRALDFIRVVIGHGEIPHPRREVADREAHRRGVVDLDHMIQRARGAAVMDAIACDVADAVDIYRRRR